MDYRMKLTVITVMLFCTSLVLCSLWGDRRKALTWLFTSMKNKLFMKTFSYLCLSAFLCCCLCACGHLPYPRVLQQADSLAETCPDSAYAWLAGWADSVRLMPERVQMRYRLLAVKAADKAYVRHTSDSVIRMAVDYFENHRDEALLPEAYYYAGRVYSDLGNAPQALDYFGKAARALPPQGGERLAERIYSQMGTLFSYRKMYREALEMYRKACECDKALKDTVGLIFAWRDIGKSYQGLGRPDSALYHLRQAVEMARTSRQAGLADMAEGQLAGLYLQTQQYDSAGACLQRAFRHPHRASRSGLYTMAAEWCYRTGKTDSAVYYWTLLADSGTVYAKRTACFALAQVALQRQDADCARTRFVQYQAYDDSIHRLEDRETLRQMHALYNYNLREEENRSLKAEQRRHRYLFYGGLGVCAVLLAWAVARVQYVRRKHLQLTIRLEKAERVRDELEKQSSRYIRENEQKVAELERRLQEAEEAGSRQLEWQRRQLLHDNEQLKLALEWRRQTASALEGSDVRKDLELRLSAVNGSEKQLKAEDWERIEQEVLRVVPGFKSKLYGLYPRFSEHEYHICLLIRLGIRPTDIGTLTAHGKESITAARRRMYQKVYGVKGEPHEWDKIIAML